MLPEGWGLLKGCHSSPNKAYDYWGLLLKHVLALTRPYLVGWMTPEIL